MEDSDADSGETEPLVTLKGEPNSEDLSENVSEAFPPTTTTKEGKKNQETIIKKSVKSKRSRESLSPSLQALEEANENNDEYSNGINFIKDESEQERNEEKPSMFCPIFGVRDYLQHFYEKAEVRNPNIYEYSPQQQASEAHEAIFLVKRRDGICSSSIFRLSLMLGGLILLMGTTALIVAACASRRATLVGKVGGVAVVDRVAAAHNAEVDALLLVSMIALILGATVVATALISRSFCRRPEYEDAFREGVMPTSYSTIYPNFLPVTQQLIQVQPWISASHLNIKSNIY